MGGDILHPNRGITPDKALTGYGLIVTTHTAEMVSKLPLKGLFFLDSPKTYGKECQDHIYSRLTSWTAFPGSWKHFGKVDI